MQEAVVNVFFAVGKKSAFSRAAYERLKGFPMAIWIELMGTLDDDRIKNLLSNFSYDMPSILVETCIINVSDKLQSELVKKYSKRID